MAVRGIRGAITVAENTREALLDAAREMVSEIIGRNSLDSAEISSILFSATNDLSAAYPAVAARELGLVNTPLFCIQEMHVEGSLRLCLRALVQVNTDCLQKEMVHVYLRGAKVLRPDIVD